MKKTYSNPKMEVVKIATQQMLAISGETITTDPTPVNPSSTDAPGFVEIDELDLFKNM